MSQRAGAADVDVEHVAYAEVGEKAPGIIDKNAQYIEQGNIPDIFRYYVEEVAVQGDTSDVVFGIFSESSSVKPIVEGLYNDTADPDTFVDRTVDLAKQLNNQMPGSANEGVLFVAKATVGIGERDPQDVVCLLKLDTEEDQRLVLADEGISAVDEENAFPPRENLQKGAVYPKIGIPPYGIGGDIKIYQNSDSSYFEAFFGVEKRIPSAVERGRSVMNLIRDVVSERLKRDLTSDDISTLVNMADEDNDGNVDETVLSGALTKITGEETSEDDISDLLSEEDLPNLRVNSNKIPKKIKRTVKTESGSIDIKYHLSADSKVEIENTDSGKRITITGFDMDTEYKER